VTNLEFRPVFAGFDPSALRIVTEGVPVFPRAATVTNKHLAAELLAVMGDRDVVLMKGHGITVTGGSLEEATSQAIRFDRLARIMWELAASGKQADVISAEDMARYNRQGRAERSRTGWREVVEGAENFAWNHYVKLLEVSEFGLPDDLDSD
jgi:ribulose-5-phosphate 4-epimerase/fuculose-1-phosphate aldolase